MDHYVIAYTARRVDVLIILISGKIMAKSGCKRLSLAGERECVCNDIFREEKIQKERNCLRGPMTEGHLMERSFLEFYMNMRNWY